jgi:hypothetical protein
VAKRGSGGSLLQVAGFPVRPINFHPVSEAM